MGKDRIHWRGLRVSSERPVKWTFNDGWSLPFWRSSCYSIPGLLWITVFPGQTPLGSASRCSQRQFRNASPGRSCSGAARLRGTPPTPQSRGFVMHRYMPRARSLCRRGEGPRTRGEVSAPSIRAGNNGARRIAGRHRTPAMSYEADLLLEIRSGATLGQRLGRRGLSLNRSPVHGRCVDDRPARASAPPARNRSRHQECAPGMGQPRRWPGTVDRSAFSRGHTVRRKPPGSGKAV